MWSMPKKTRRGALVLAGTLALVFFNHLNQAEIIWLGIPIVVLLFYGLSGLVTRKNLSVAERIGRSLVLLCGCSGLVYGYAWHFWLEDARVTIAPNQERFSSEPLENYIFTVTNGTRDDAYAVQLQFRLDSPDGKYGEISTQVPAGSRKPIVENSQFSDIGGVLCHDSEGHPFLMMIIYRLTPGEKREVSFTSRGFTDGTTLEAEVSSFTKEPRPRRDDPTSIRDIFTVDHSLKCSNAFHCMAGDGTCRTN
jgi:hypothetical protein